MTCWRNKMSFVFFFHLFVWEPTYNNQMCNWQTWLSHWMYRLIENFLSDTNYMWLVWWSDAYMYTTCMHACVYVCMHVCMFVCWHLYKLNTKRIEGMINYKTTTTTTLHQLCWLWRFLFLDLFVVFGLFCEKNIITVLINNTIKSTTATATTTTTLTMENGNKNWLLLSSSLIRYCRWVF